jgi:hypothetical protein
MKKTLWLNDNRDQRFRRPDATDDFIIRKMKNTTKFKIGQTISVGEVSGLLGVKHGYSWDIIIEGKR